MPPALLTLVAAAAKDPEVQRTLWEFLLYVCSGILTLSAVVLLGWKVVLKPHVTEFVRKVSAVHKSVTVNGGENSPPTLRDDISHLTGQVQQLTHIAGATAQRTSDLADRIDTIHELVTDTRDDFRAHERKGELYLGKVQVVLRDQGIELPDAD